MPWVLIVLAAVLLIVSSLTIWAKRQLLDTDNWTTSSSELLEDPAIRNAISVYLVNQLYNNVDVAGELQQGLPPRAQPLAAPLAAVLKEASVRATDALLARPRVQQLWETANRTAHKQFLVIINGGRRLQTSNGEVVLDLRPILNRLAQTSVGARVVADLPPDAGRLVIMKSNQLKLAQKGVRAVKWLSVLVSLIVLVLLAVAVWISPYRRKIILGAGVACVVCALIVLVARRYLGNYVVDALTENSPDFRGAADDAWSIGTDLLRDIGINLLVYGLVIIAAALLAGPSRAARALRRWMAPTLVHRPVVTYAVFVCAFLLLVLLGPTDAQRLVPLLVLFAFGLVGVEALRRQVAREHPEVAAAQPSAV